MSLLMGDIGSTQVKRARGTGGGGCIHLKGIVLLDVEGIATK